MIHRRPFLLLAAIVIATMACSFSFSLPGTEFEAGPLVTEEINVPLAGEAESATQYLDLSFGAGRLSIEAGNGEELVSGTATYNVAELAPIVDQSGSQVRLTQGEFDPEGIVRMDRSEIRNEWDLSLATVPMELTIAAGGYVGEYELGGLALEALQVSDGAADVRMSFSEPNLSAMRTFRYETGASNIQLNGLGNANFERMIFRGGAGALTMDFSGQLRRDADVEIDAGLSSLIIIVPEGVPASLTLQGGLTNVRTSGKWAQNGQRYSLAGEGPSLTIHVSLAAGSLELRNR